MQLLNDIFIAIMTPALVLAFMIALFFDDLTELRDDLRRRR